MMKREIILLLTFYLTGVLPSCIKNTCDDYKYIDYDGIEVDVQNNLVQENDSLYFRVNPLGTKFLAENKIEINFINRAYAQIDCDKGWGGDKYPLKEFQ